MKTQPNYSTIGIFVSIGMALLLGAVAVLGTGALWRETVTIETYMDQSVQGLDTGSQVKMRGVRVGKVDNITFVHLKYPEAREIQDRYVLLEISLELQEFGHVAPKDFKAHLENEINRGLRIRLLPMGLTGAAYIEMDYLDPQRHPALQINWTPDHPYIPSAPGPFARLEETFDSLSRTMANIEEIDLQNTLNQLEHLIQSLDESISSLDTAGLSSQAQVFLEELRQSNKRISMLLGPEDLEKREVVSLHSVLIDSQKILRSVQKGLDHLEMDREDGTADKLARTIVNLHLSSEKLPGVMEDISAASMSLKKSTQGFEALTTRTYSLLRTQNEELREVLDNMRMISENLLDTSLDARRYPSYILFGDQPQKSEFE